MPHAQAPRNKAGTYARLEARITPEQKELLVLAAAISGRSLTDFVVTAAQRQAERILRDHDVIRLTQRDSVAFANAVLNPPPPHPRLVKAAQRYAELVHE